MKKARRSLYLIWIFNTFTIYPVRNTKTMWEQKDTIGNPIYIEEDQESWKNYLQEKANDESLSEKDRAYYQRILRVLDMPNLSEIPGHPINLIIRRIVDSPYFEWFDHIKMPEIVTERATLDVFDFPQDHVTRRPSDSYFIKKTDNPKESIMLRPHTSVMWYYYLLEGGWKEKLEQEGEIKGLSWWKVYRVDDLDKTHHECFHQIDGLKIANKEKQIITQETLKEVLASIVKSLYGENVNYRFNEDQFPYTVESLELEVEADWEWLEVVGAGIVKSSVLEKLWLDPEKYNGWAFGFGIERLAMPMKKVPDIRIFWSDDERITKQRWDMEPFKEVSSFPPVYKDISFIVPKWTFERNLEEEKKSWKTELLNEADSFEIAGIVRDVSGGLVEEVNIIDIYENDKKFGEDKKSVTIRITFRSNERTLTNEEINKIYFDIRYKLENELGYCLR